MTQGRMTLGPRDGTGYKITVTRGFDDGTERYTSKAVEYDCYGVEDVEVDDPWQIGGGKECLIDVTFTNGTSIYLHGVVSDIEVDA